MKFYINTEKFVMKNSVDLGFKMSIFNKDDTRSFINGRGSLDRGTFKLANLIFSLPVCYFAIRNFLKKMIR